MVISETEMDDFRMLLKENGHKEPDFILSESDLSQPSIEIYPIHGKVTITCKKTDKSRTYNTGHGTAWVCEFADDLEAGVFAD